MSTFEERYPECYALIRQKMQEGDVFFFGCRSRNMFTIYVRKDMTEEDVDSFSDELSRLVDIPFETVRSEPIKCYQE